MKIITSLLKLIDGLKSENLQTTSSLIIKFLDYTVNLHQLPSLKYGLININDYLYKLKHNEDENEREINNVPDQLYM